MVFLCLIQYLNGVLVTSSAGFPLLPWIRKPSKQEFVEFLQESINVASAQNVTKFGPLQVDISPPGLTPANNKGNIVYRTKCFIHADEDVTMEALTTVGVHVVFEEITRHKRRKLEQKPIITSPKLLATSVRAKPERVCL
eukprot:TRINITY_DN3059_c0_g2_i2.p1 TRINITY_DN3059_c0_g2~~TRINITY_DN3059_c0_g2_i2.p1  ORF type:complete len:140 (+),score=22.31 TRINITY_DN3059_c0_g2_i2:89-508(+)